MKKFLAIMIIALSVLAAAPAQAREWRIDDHHSQAVFTIQHIVGKVTGFFNSFQFPDKNMTSTVRFDPNNPEQGHFDIVINTWTVDTGIERRDKHLSTSDFFDCRNYPVIRFNSDNIRKTKDGSYEADGKLTIKDVTKDVTVAFDFLGSKPHPAMDKDSGALVAELNINRLDYHVGDGTFSKMGMVGEQVSLTIYLEMFEK